MKRLLTLPALPGQEVQWLNVCLQIHVGILNPKVVALGEGVGRQGL